MDFYQKLALFLPIFMVGFTILTIPKSIATPHFIAERDKSPETQSLETQILKWGFL